MSDMLEESFYELLEVNANATFEEIESSYQRIVAYLDTDSLAIYSMVEDDEVSQKRSAVDQAFRILSDPNRRAAYDRSLTAGEATYPPVVVPDVGSDSNMSVGHLGSMGMDSDPASAETTLQPSGAGQDFSTRESTTASPNQSWSRQSNEIADVESSPNQSWPRQSHEIADVESSVSASRSGLTQERSGGAVTADPQSSPQSSSTRSPAASDSTSSNRPNDTDMGVRESESPLATADRMRRSLDNRGLVPTPRVQRPLASKKVRRLQPSLDVEIGDDAEFSGSLLRRLRESAGASLQDVADITKISKRYVHALEENDFSSLPAAVYVRGFVTEYARALGIEPLRVAKSYMALFTRYKNGGSDGK